MLKDTLDMIPVAIILAFTLYFGSQGGRTVAAPRSEKSESIVHGSINGSRSNGDLPVIVGSLIDEPMPAEDAAGIPSPELLATNVHDEPIRDRYITWRTSPTVSHRITSRDVAHSSVNARMATAAEHDERFYSNAATSHKRAEYSGQGARLQRLDLNTVDLQSLLTVPGIGRSRANMLIDARPRGGYRDWSEIDRLPGFGEGMISMLKLYMDLR